MRRVSRRCGEDRWAPRARSRSSCRGAPRTGIFRPTMAAMSPAHGPAALTMRLARISPRVVRRANAAAPSRSIAVHAAAAPEARAHRPGALHHREVAFSGLILPSPGTIPRRWPRRRSPVRARAARCRRSARPRCRGVFQRDLGLRISMSSSVSAIIRPPVTLPSRSRRRRAGSPPTAPPRPGRAATYRRRGCPASRRRRSHRTGAARAGCRRWRPRPAGYVVALDHQRLDAFARQPVGQAGACDAAADHQRVDRLGRQRPASRGRAMSGGTKSV